MPKIRRPDGSEINVGRLPLVPKHLLEQHRAQKMLTTVPGARALLAQYSAKVNRLIGRPRVPLRSSEEPAGVKQLPRVTPRADEARQRSQRIARIRQAEDHALLQGQDIERAVVPGSGSSDVDSTTTLPGGNPGGGDGEQDERLQPDDPSVNYRFASDPAESCGQCQHYLGNGSCERILGMVRVSDTCNLWTQAAEPLVDPTAEELPVEQRARRGAEEAAREFRRKYDSEAEDEAVEPVQWPKPSKGQIDRNYSDNKATEAGARRVANALGFLKSYRDSF